MAKAKKQPNAITSLAEAEQVMQRINAIEKDCAWWDLREAEAVAQARAKYAAKRLEGGHAELCAERKALVRQLETFAKADRKNWNGRQSATTRFGKYGFHAGLPRVALIKKISKTFEDALSKLATLAHSARYIRTHKEINKDQILADHAEAKTDALKEYLAGAGLKVDQNESFSVTTSAAADLKASLEKLKGA